MTQATQSNSSRARHLSAPAALLFRAGTVAGMLMLAACTNGSNERSSDELGSQPAPTTAIVESAPAMAQPSVDAAATPTGSGPDLGIADGWVDGASNGVGVQGAFFTYEDSSGRTVIAEHAGEQPASYCVSGEAAQVLDEDYSGTWGAVAALNLRQEVGVDTADAYDADAHAVLGFSFQIMGDTGGALRYMVKQHNVHDGFCINNVPDCGMGCSTYYRFDELTQNCWDSGGAAPLTTELVALEWQIVPNADAPVSFDFCVQNIRAIHEGDEPPLPFRDAGPGAVAQDAATAERADGSAAISDAGQDALDAEAPLSVATDSGTSDPADARADASLPDSP